jgi:hypothetical protein
MVALRAGVEGLKCSHRLDHGDTNCIEERHRPLDCAIPGLTCAYLYPLDGLESLGVCSEPRLLRP